MISKQLPYLPEEMITNILTYLPVKTLIRFKCVSKFFLSLISNPQFINAHLHISSKYPKFIQYRRIPCLSHTRLDLKSYSLDHVLTSHHYKDIKLDSAIIGTYPFILHVGSFNGLLCIAINRILVLWNPSTTVLKKIPGVDREYNFLGLCGFGLDERTNDYKVVMIFHSNYRPRKNTMGRVYSLRADSWYNITDIPFHIHGNESGKFTNGSLHWAMKVSVFPKLWTILSFDLSNDTYGRIEHPNYNAEGSRGAILGILQGCLSVLVDFENFSTDLWVMKEYGVKDSWVKLYAIPYCGRPWRYVWFFFPLLITSNGELLTEARESYILYNPKEETFRDIGVIQFDSLTNVFTYVESLVSPYTETV